MWNCSIKYLDLGQRFKNLGAIQCVGEDGFPGELTKLIRIHQQKKVYGKIVTKIFESKII